MKKTWIIILLLLAAGKSYAFLPQNSGIQDSAKATLQPKLRQTIWLNGGQLFRKEIQLSYERFLTDWLALEITGGYKYAKPGKQPYEITLSSVINFPVYEYVERMPFSEGILGGISFKIYPGAKNPEYARTYVASQFFYRNRYFENQKIIITTEKDNDGRASDGGLQSVDMHIYGGKLLVGRTISLIDFTKKNSLLVDFYGGIGYRLKNARIDYHDYDRNLPPSSPYYRPQIKKYEESKASLHAGFRLGFQF